MRGSFTPIALVFAVAVFSGCATSAAARLAALEGESAYQVWTERTGRYTFLTERCPDEKHRVGSCEEVAGTKDATQTEFWKYKQYIPVEIRVFYGAIPVSPKFKDENHYVIGGVPGNQAMCEARRVQIKKPRGVAGDDGDIWADPCFGPFYFRHVPPEAESAKR